MGSPAMTLLATALVLLVLGQEILISGIELDTEHGLNRFHEYQRSYFQQNEQHGGYVTLYRNAHEKAKRRNRGPLVVGRYNRRKKVKEFEDSPSILIPGSNGAASNNGGIIKWKISQQGLHGDVRGKL